MNNEIRFLIRTATIAPDGLLVTKGDSSTYIPGEPKEKIIVPHNIAAGTLYHLHNSKYFMTHPSQNQLKTAFNRRFYTWNLQSLLQGFQQVRKSGKKPDILPFSKIVIY